MGCAVRGPRPALEFVSCTCLRNRSAGVQRLPQRCWRLAPPVVVAVAADSVVPAHKLRRIQAVLDPEPVLDAELMALLEWAAGYYQHPPGEVMAAAMPALLRHGRASETGEIVWHWSDASRISSLQGVLVLDGTDTVAAQDQRIAGEIQEAEIAAVRPIAKAREDDEAGSGQQAASSRKGPRS